VPDCIVAPDGDQRFIDTLVLVFDVICRERPEYQGLLTEKAFRAHETLSMAHSLAYWPWKPFAWA